MTNHVHILATPLRADAMSKLMQVLNRNYLRYYNNAYGRSGTLWEGRFKSCVVETSRYLLHCYRYIEQNPVRAGMVENPAAYGWSSYCCNALGVESKLVTPHIEYLQLGKNLPSRLHAYRELFNEHMDTQMLQDIRASTNKNMALGTTRFKEEIEATLSRRVRPASPGRPRKEK